MRSLLNCRAFVMVVMVVTVVTVVTVAGGCGDSASDNTGVRGAIVLIDTPDNGMTTVTLFAAGGTTAQAATTTDATGGFKFAKLPAGTYRLHAEHSGYAALERDSILVSDSQNGEQNLGNLVMNRLFLAGGGGTVTPGAASPDGKKRLFQIDDTLELYDQDTGKLTPLPSDFPFAGGLFTTDDQYLLAKVLSTGADLAPDMAVASFAPPPTPSGSQFALYVLPLAGTPPWAVSYSVLTAGMGPNAQFGFVVVPAASGTGDNVDLYTFPIAATATPPKLVGAELPLSQLRLVRAAGYSDDNLGIYQQILFAHDPVDTAHGQAYDWSLLDLSTGVATTLVAGVDGSSVFAAQDPDRALFVWVHHTGPVNTDTSDVHTYLLGDAAAKKVGSFDSLSFATLPTDPAVSAPPAGVYLFNELSAAPATDVYLVSTATGDNTSLGRVLGLLFDGVFSNASLRRDGNHAWVLRVGGAGGAELCEVTLTTGDIASLVGGLTRSSGSAVGDTDTINDPTIAQLLSGQGNGTASRLVVNTGADGTSLTPVLVDGGGAHALASAPAYSWGRVSVSTDGKLVAYPDPTSGVAWGSVPATGGVTVNRIAGSAVVGALARAGLDGASVAWTKPVTSTFEYHSFQVSGATDTLMATVATASFAIADLLATSQVVMGIDGANQSQLVRVAVGATPTSGPSFTMGLSGLRWVGTANGQRLAVLDPGPQSLYEIAAGAPPTYGVQGGVSLLLGFPSGQRWLARLPSAMRIVDQDGTAQSVTGGLALLQIDPQGIHGLERSPDGERVFFRDQINQVLVTIGAAGAATTTSLLVTGDSLFYVRGVGAAIVAVGFDPTSNVPALVAIDRSSGAATTLSSTVQGGGQLSPSATPGSQPWPSLDGKTLFYFDRKPADMTAMTPASLQLWAFQSGAAPSLIADRAQLNPPPQLGADGSLELRAAVDTLTGTASVIVVPAGSLSPSVVASRVRSSLTNAASRAAVLLDGTNLSLASGATNGPLTTMGAVQFFDLTGNLAWGSQQLYVIDRATTSSDGGTLYTGAIGAAGLTKVARGVLGVFPDATGAQAAVVSLDGTGKGLLVGRFATTTLGM